MYFTCKSPPTADIHASCPVVRLRERVPIHAKIIISYSVRILIIYVKISSVALRSVENHEYFIFLWEKKC